MLDDMSRSSRMFEIIQVLRSAPGATTARELAARLEVSSRTVYRDIVALQAMRVPIEGEAGIGYVLRPGFDLPPLMFTPEEVEAIAVGLAMIRRTADSGLEAAARSAAEKIDSVLPGGSFRLVPLRVSGWHDIPEADLDLGLIREAIREEAALALAYRDLVGQYTERTVRPIALTYHTNALVLAAWCESRQAFRHFRVDRIEACTPTGGHFRGQGADLRRRWEAERTAAQSAETKP